MSTNPFRSDLEQYGEKLRRSEETVDRLTAENHELQNEIDRHLDLRGRSRAWIVGGTFLAASAASAGVGWAAATEHAVEAQVARDRLSGLTLQGVRAEKAQCMTARTKAEQGLAQCVDRLEGALDPIDLASGDSWMAPSPRPHERCACMPGDPLCACLSRDFERRAAARALDDVRPGVEACIGPRRRASIHATLVYSPDGTVTSVRVDDGGLSTNEEKCMATQLHHAGIPPFDGPSVRVGKRYTFEP